MRRLTVRVADDLLAHLDALQAERALPDRSAALRLALREARMTPGERQTVPDRDELLRLLAERARDGNVQAMKILLEEQRRHDDEDTKLARSRIDELASRRASRAG